MLKGLYQNFLKNRICPNRLIFLQGVYEFQIVCVKVDFNIYRFIFLENNEQYFNSLS